MRILQLPLLLIAPLCSALILAAAPSAQAQAQAGLVVVAHPELEISALTQDEVVNIFLGRYRQLASGVSAAPIDLAYDSPMRSEFYRLLVNKSLTEINAYWSRLRFSGKTKPPQEVKDAAAAIEMVQQRPGALAYVDRSALGDAPGVQILFSFTH